MLHGGIALGEEKVVTALKREGQAKVEELEETAIDKKQSLEVIKVNGLAFSLKERLRTMKDNPKVLEKTFLCLRRSRMAEPH